MPASKRSAVAFAAAAALVYVACWGAVHYWFYRYDLIGDVGIYRSYGEAMRHGAVPYRDFPFEYPPGALPVMLLPAFFRDYAGVFGVEMGVAGVLVVLLMAYAAPRRGVAFVAVSPLLIGSLVLNRFDLWPTLLATAGLIALLRDRHRLGWVALGAAFAAKLWPVVLLPLAVVWTFRRRGRGELARSATAGAAVVVAAFTPFLVLAPHGLWQSVWGQISRPMEIESLGASVLMLTHHAGVAMSHGGYDVSGRLVRPLTVLTTVSQISVLVALWIAFARRPLNGERLVRYAAACVCAFIAFAKVLSPQYLIWLVPLVALIRGWRGLRAMAILGAALILTQILYPERFYTYVYHHQLAWLVLLRNLLLVALVGALALGRRPRRPTVDPGGRTLATTLR
jgi:uncharacterized membrane protein